MNSPRLVRRYIPAAGEDGSPDAAFRPSLRPSRSGCAELRNSKRGHVGNRLRYGIEKSPPIELPGPLDPQLLARLRGLCDEGWDIWDRFDIRVRQHAFHPFVAADYGVVLDALIPMRAPGLRFLEWGSASGVITIMADLLGFDAYGIELDGELVGQAKELARKMESGAAFTAGSFLPTGYRWKDGGGDDRLGTIGHGDSGYLQLGMPLDDFDVVFGYPWDGEKSMMLDLMRVHGRPGARLVVHSEAGIEVWRGGRLVSGRHCSPE